MTTGSEATAGADWFPHANGRWVVEDAGRQAEVEPMPAGGPDGVRPDTVLDGGRLGGLTYRATSQRGLAHQNAGVVRQDSYLVRPTGDDRWLIGCVADGVSNGPRSHLAADLVCRSTTMRLAQFLRDLGPPGDAEVWTASVNSLGWPEIVAETSESIRKEPGWGSSTAVVFAVAAEPLADGGHPALVAVLAGDSTALLLGDGTWTPLGAVKNDGAEIASTAVTALPGEVPAIRPQARMLRPGQALVVISDGLGDPLGSGGGVVGRFLATMWQRPPDLLAYAGHVGFYRKSFTDDRTAVTIWAGVP
ncbi:protein phosphatase 2C domain-containing protein [Paractinoplanes atraurantiacus]|uniref:Protein phosphatase 2C n=1 Tax=Paractinoplanes atraurantiacus TaxID=1036182 RepID=A0A285JY42_9ACTN|nr:protein phosphatase 2C domain-containing protein [Actinoplanes atraurantiacus]SNY65262.1 Protein phosphatase 2C [Actinoplanes atraurantiacus]